MLVKSRGYLFIVVALVGFLNVDVVHSLVEGLYCGVENCYDVLGVTRDSTKSEIAKAYRSLARKYHPDVQGPSVSKEEAEANFRRIATAYEVLRDEDSRVDYDYMVDHPEELYSHYYRYYRRRAAPNVDIRLVVAVCITIISAIQYYSAYDRYETAIKYLTTVQKYRIHAESSLNHEQQQQQTMVNMGQQFMYEMQRSVNQVINAPHFGFEWVKPDYYFDPMNEDVKPVINSSDQINPPSDDNTESSVNSIVSDCDVLELYNALEEFSNKEDLQQFQS